MLRTALIGCGNRGTNIYLPVLVCMKQHFQLVAVCDEQLDRANAAANASGADAFGDIDHLLTVVQPDLAIISVTPPPSDHNALIALRCLEAGVPILAETPIALTLNQAKQLVDTAYRQKIPAEIAENYFRTRECVWFRTGCLL
jgi:predicted dehydrogenase